MTISNTSRIAGPFIGNGSTMAFPFSYKVFSREDVLVAVTSLGTQIETILSLDSDYNVTLNANQDTNPGGVINLALPLASGYTLAATSNIALLQALDLTNQGGFYPKVINDALDRIVINIQQLAAKIGQGINVGGAALSQAALSALALVQTFSTSAGAKSVGYMLDAPGAVLGNIDDVLNEEVSVFRFMTKAQIANVRSGAGTLDLTAPIQAAVNYAYTKNIGTVRFPAGVFKFTTIVRNWDAIRSINIVGSGTRSTQFGKFGTSTTPLFDWSANENILETYANFESFTIIGTGKAHHGIRVTKCARFSIRDVYIGGCDRAIDNQGSLVWYGQGLTLQGNNYGLYTDRSPTAAGGFIYPNAITLRDSRLCFNTTYAISARFANGMRIRDCDVESNGTSQDQSTGGVFFAQTHVEAGLGSISLDGTWFEGNKGWAFTMDSANNLTSLSIKDIQFIGSESGRACRVINARSVLIQAVMAVTPGDTVSVAADHFILENSTISAVIDNSTRSTWTNVITANDPIGEGGFSQGITVSNGKPLTLSWARGAGKATLTPDTNNGHLDYATASGLHRFKNQIGFFEPIPLANARALSFFVDAADGKAKFKDAGGVVNLLY